MAGCREVWLNSKAGFFGAPGLGEPALGWALVGLSIMAHEMAHAWDCTNGGFGAKWSTEGLATWISNELLRRYQGESLDGNEYYDPVREFRWIQIPTWGLFSLGYGEALSFLHQIAWTLYTQHGLPWDDAIGAVARGSSEGWFGQRATPGLAARVRALGDPDWDPVDARLDWILSLAVDDRATGDASAYHVPYVRDAWRGLEDSPFLPGIYTFFYEGTIVAGEGESLDVSPWSGANGYMLVEDPQGRGIPLEGRGDGAPVVWRILRFR